MRSGSTPGGPGARHRQSEGIHAGGHCSNDPGGWVYDAGGAGPLHAHDVDCELVASEANDIRARSRSGKYGGLY